MIREFCTSAILLNNGQLLAQGSVDEVIARYEQLDGESPV
jgi:ABC-type polysaccharide/polyol phosphate transport system ATPase subunit